MPYNFLQDIGEGIFNRLSELRVEQQTKDDQKRKLTLNALSSIFDQLEPDSKAALMPIIGKTIGVEEKYAPKGLKGLWEAFSGYPNKSVENQLGDILRETSGMMMPSSQARGIRQKADVARMFGAESPFSGMVPGPQATARAGAVQAEKDLGNKLIFRDQRAEDLEKIRERYEAQTILQNERLNIQNWYKDKSREDQQAHALELEDEKAKNRAQAKVRNYAWTIAKQRGLVEPTAAEEAEAGLYLIQKGDADLNYIRQRTDLAKSQAYLAEIQAGAIKSGAALTPGQASFANLEERKFGAAEDAFKAYNQSRSGIAGATKKVNDALAELNAQIKVWTNQPSAYYDPKTRTVMGLQAQAGRSPAEVQQTGNMSMMLGTIPQYKKAYDDANAELEKLNVQVSGQKNALSGHGKYIQWDPTTGEPIQARRSNRDNYGFIPEQGDHVIKSQPAGKYHMNQEINTPSGKKYIIRVEPVVGSQNLFNYYVGDKRK